MKIYLKVNTFAKKEKIEKIQLPDTNLPSYKVDLTVKPIEWKANKKLKQILSNFFSVPKTKISITAWEKSKYKILEFKD